MKVLLADDEHLIREGLRDAVDWKAHGMEVVALAENGEQALALARSLRPDLVVTDICMPFMDGLELTEALLGEFPEIAVILLTCYDEFQYAKRAIKLGVADYVLKPIDLEYMEKLLGELAQKHEDSLRRGKDEQKRLLAEVLHRQCCSADGAERVQAVSLQPEAAYACLLVTLLGYSFAQESFDGEALREYFASFVAQVQACAQTDALLIESSEAEGNVLLVLEGSTSGEAGQRMRSVCERLRVHDGLRNEYPFFCATDGTGLDLWALPTALSHCQTLTSYAFQHDETTFVDYTELHHLRQDDGLQISLDIASFVESVRTFDRGVIAKRAKEITEHIRSSGRYSAMYGQMFVASAYSQITGALQECGIVPQDIFENPAEEYRRVVSASSLQQQIAGLGELLGRVCDYVQSRKGSALHMTAEKARQYIETCYAQNELSLQQVAAAIHMSSSYFSILFKREIGKSFISYLTDVRMEHAKQLLLYTDQKAYEISESVGYDNPTYFSTLFKKHEGLSPKEFRIKNCGAFDETESKTEMKTKNC